MVWWIFTIGIVGSIWPTHCNLAKVSNPPTSQILPRMCTPETKPLLYRPSESDHTQISRCLTWCCGGASTAVLFNFAQRLRSPYSWCKWIVSVIYSCQWCGMCVVSVFFESSAEKRSPMIFEYSCAATAKCMIIVLWLLCWPVDCGVVDFYYWDSWFNLAHPLQFGQGIKSPHQPNFAQNVHPWNEAAALSSVWIRSHPNIQMSHMVLRWSVHSGFV